MVRGSKNPLHFGLPARLKRARRQCGLRRLPLAEKAGVASSTEREIEAGQRLPTVATVARLAAALGMSAPWLAYGLGEQASQSIAASCEGMGERLRVMRTERGYSRTGLARVAELNPGTIVKIEGGGQAGVDTVERLAKELRLSPAWLAYGVGDRELPPRRRSRSANVSPTAESSRAAHITAPSLDRRTDTSA